MLRKNWLAMTYKAGFHPAYRDQLAAQLDRARLSICRNSSQCNAVLQCRGEAATGKDAVRCAAVAESAVDAQALAQYAALNHDQASQNRQVAGVQSLLV